MDPDHTPTVTSRPTAPLVLTPFHAAGFAFLATGLLLAAYQGLQDFGVVPRAPWIGWSHIHFVTVGAFTQLLFGMLPQLTARKLDVPAPSRCATWARFGALNGGFVMVWIGRAFGPEWSYDAGLVIVWLTVAALFLALVRSVLRADRTRRRDVTVGLYLISPIALLTGLTFAFALYTDTFAFEVPGGWWGLREGHVHANAWGFLGLAAIGTLYDLFPRLVGAPLQHPRARSWSFWLLAAGIGPLTIGPILGMGRSVTGTGLALFGVGYLLYVYNLVATYRVGTRSGLALSVLIAQAWILGPAGFAPFILFGVPLGIPEPWIETGALHFFFMGWALPLALAGLALHARNLPGPRAATAAPPEPRGLLPHGVVPGSIVKGWMIAVWNASVVVVAFGFFYRDAAWSPFGLAVGFSLLTLLWAVWLVRIVGQRRALLAHATTVG